MQSKNRAIRILALTQSIATLQQALVNPFTTVRDAERLGDHLLTTIHSVLDNEYQQGYEDGTFFGINISADYLGGELQ